MDLEPGPTRRRALFPLPLLPAATAALSAAMLSLFSFGWTEGSEVT